MNFVEAMVRGALLVMGATYREAERAWHFIRPRPTPATPEQFAADLRAAWESVRGEPR